MSQVKERHHSRCLVPGAHAAPECFLGVPVRWVDAVAGRQLSSVKLQAASTTVHASKRMQAVAVMASGGACSLSQLPASLASRLMCAEPDATVGQQFSCRVHG